MGKEDRAWFRDPRSHRLGSEQARYGQGSPWTTALVSRRRRWALITVVVAIALGASAVWFRPGEDQRGFDRSGVTHSGASSIAGLESRLFQRPNLDEPLIEATSLNRIVQRLGEPDLVWLNVGKWARANWPAAASAIQRDDSNLRDLRSSQHFARETLARLSKVDISRHSPANLRAYWANYRAAERILEVGDPLPSYRVDHSALCDASSHPVLRDVSGGELEAMLAGESLDSVAKLAARWGPLTLFFDGEFRLCHAFKHLVHEP
jgi:hypothetical protein